MERTILHVDMNAFFASVENLFHPEVHGKPMAVCGDTESRRGVILAKNELAKQYGVRTAEPVWQAQRKCSGLILLPPHHALYREFSHKANEIYRRYTDLVEPFSIDESFLDVTGSLHLFGSGKEIADQIRTSVRNELGLTVSVGVSFCKIFAKLGSDYKKPDATTVITHENYKKLLYPLPITDLMYVGHATAEILNRRCIRTIGDLAQLDEKTLMTLLGKHGHTLYIYSHGLDTEPVRPPTEREIIKSVGNGKTFSRDLITNEDVQTGLLHLCESVAGRLRQKKLKCWGIQVTIKTPDLKSTDRQKKLSHATYSTREIYQSALDLLLSSWSAGHPIRMLTVTALYLGEENAPEQLDLFSTENQNHRLAALEASVDILRQRYGKNALRPANSLKTDIGLDND